MRGQTNRPAHVAGWFGSALVRGKMALQVGLIIFGLGLVGTPSSWANSLTYQNVTFNMTINGSGYLELNVLNALNATGDWTGIDHLNAFQINNYGTASNLSVTGWTTVPGGLSAGGGGGCNGSGGGTCFSFGNPPDPTGFLLTNDFTLTIMKTSGSFNLLLPGDNGGFGPHLKVFFSGADQGDGHGSLLSQNVPVPGTLLIFGLGFMVFVIWYQLHSRKQIALASMA